MRSAIPRLRHEGLQSVGNHTPVTFRVATSKEGQPRRSASPAALGAVCAQGFAILVGVWWDLAVAKGSGPEIQMRLSSGCILPYPPCTDRSPQPTFPPPVQSAGPLVTVPRRRHEKHPVCLAAAPSRPPPTLHLGPRFGAVRPEGALFTQFTKRVIDE